MQSGASVEVHRNDAIPAEIMGVYDAAVLSPGPGIPEEAGEMMSFIRRFAPKIPLLGVCLGHQALAEHFGGKIVNMTSVCHGSSTECKVVADDPLFEGLSAAFEVGHYHSWMVDADQPGADISIIAKNTPGWVMAIRHKYLPLHGVQFHPESVMTPEGQRIINNWVSFAETYRTRGHDRKNDSVEPVGV